MRDHGPLTVDIFTFFLHKKVYSCAFSLLTLTSLRNLWERLDHLGIGAGVCQEIGLASWLDAQEPGNRLPMGRSALAPPGVKWRAAAASYHAITSFPSAGCADGGNSIESCTTTFLFLRPGNPRRFVVRSPVDSHRAYSLKRTHKYASLGERRCGEMWDRNAQRELCTHQAGISIESIERATGIQAVERVTSHDGRESDLSKSVPINLQCRSWRVQDASQAVGARDKDLWANGGNSSLSQSADAHYCRLTPYATQGVGVEQVPKTRFARDEDEAARQQRWPH